MSGIGPDYCKKIRIQFSIYPKTDSSLFQTDESISINVGGYSAVKYTNSSPLVETTVRFVTNNNGYELSLYTDEPEQEEIFDRILETFQFVSKEGSQNF